MSSKLMLALLAASLAVFAAACNGDGDDEDRTATSAPEPTATTASPGSSPTVSAPSNEDITPVVNRQPGEAWTEDDAQALLTALLLTPEDVASLGTFVVQSDATVNNADLALSNPEDVAQYESCGRLLARTQTMLAEDTVEAFFAGESVSFFSTATVYATADGATECSNAIAADYLANPQEFVAAFGNVFVDPAAVTVTPVDYPQIGEGAFAATLSGQTDAAGTIIDLTILVVAFRSGNVSSAVGSARVAQDPPTEELSPLVDLVLARIQANQ